MNDSKGFSRKKIKRDAKKVVRSHYILLVVVCMIAVMFGTEFGFVRSNADNLYKLATGQEIHIGEDTVQLGKGLVKATTGSDIREGVATTVKDQLESGVDKDTAGNLAGSVADQTTSDLQGQVTGDSEEQSAIDRVLEDLLNDDAESGNAHAQEELDKYKNQKVDKSVTGRKSGIFAAIANDISSGRLYMIIYEGIDSMIHSSRFSSAIVVFFSLAISIGVWVFIKNMLQAIIRRIFLEARIYPKVPVSHFWHFKLVKRWTRASMTLLLTTIFQYLWDLTIIGGMIKHYSYRMVPFIVAENPDLKPTEAITLSRKMMYGHKWECFIIDLTFLPWFILGTLTMGIVDAFWTVPYQTAALSEYYAYLRGEAKAKNLKNADRLNDKYLFEMAEESFLRETYSDIEEQKKYIDEHRVTLPPKRAFFAKNFGLWIGTTEEKKAYDDVDNRRQQIAEDRAVIKHKIYPQRLNPRWDDSNNLIVRSIRYIRTYTFWSVVFTFFVFAFVGWAWEVGIHLVNDGIFVNRGVLHGPWLPIYGGGVALIMVALARWRSKPLVEVVSIVVLCGLLEYFTSYFLEVTKGMRWWDYTGYFLNINGRICGEGLMVFALGGMAAVYLLIPTLDTMWSKLFKPKAMAVISIILLLIFSADFIYSGFHPNAGEGITDYKAFEEAEDTAPDTQALPDQPAEG